MGMPGLFCRVLAICWLLSSCSLTSNRDAGEDWPLLTNKEWSSTRAPSLDIQYIQVGSILLRYGDDYLLTDPFFSNPPLWRILLLRDLKGDPTLARSVVSNWRGVRGVLVGHGHYDHVLDAPFVLEQTGPETRLYGSETVVNMLRPSVPAAQLKALARRGELLETGWIKVPRSPFRFRAILSDHAPLIGSYRFAGGTVEDPLTKPPRDVMDWKEGQTLSFLIDVMRDGAQPNNPGYRIFVQTAASDPPDSPLPEELLKQKSVDLAVITAGNFDNAENYPGAWLEYLKPKRVLIAHYEPFWKPINIDSMELMPTLDMDQLLERINKHVDSPDRVYLPSTMSILTLE